jgi:membrane dipeptidase
VAELLLRGWTSKDVQGLIGGNLMRVLDKVDAVSAKLQRTTAPATDVYSKRKDL